MGKPLEVLIIFFDDFYDVGLGCASTIALALILPGLSNKVRSPRVWSADNAVFIYMCMQSHYIEVAQGFFMFSGAKIFFLIFLKLPKLPQ